MKILFLCASLEPGRDGVGDYTTRLAGELETLNHECLRVAMNDRHLAMAPGAGIISNQSAGQLRLGAWQSWQERFYLIQKVVEEFQPDWVSLQFVSWGLARRGLPFGLGAKLREAIANRPLHVMCHELWLTNIFPIPLRQRLLGVLQRAAIARFFVSLKPRAFQTHLEYYRTLLKDLQIESTLLPLHGNIPVYCTRAEGRAWLEDRTEVGSGDRVAGFFGNLWQTFDLPLLRNLVEEADTAGRKQFLFSAGSLAPTGEANWKKIETEFGGRCRVVRLGPLDENSASHYISSLDLGLTTYPAILAGKSGAVAAMLEHGTPVKTVGALREGLKGSVLFTPGEGATVAETIKKFLGAL